MEKVCAQSGEAHPMYGLYAAHRMESEYPFSVYVGEDIGAADGALDDYKGYRAMERMENEGGGRHVMSVGGRLINGVDGFSCAQYINAAFRVDSRDGWCNKAELVEGGTIRVMKGRVINAGEEILMA